MKFMTAALIAVFIIFLAFNGAMIYIYCAYASVPDTLIVSVNSALLGEGGFCALIKHANERTQQRRWELEDRKYSETHKNLIKTNDENFLNDEM